MLNFWYGFAILLITAEFILPGLVSVFVGLGALTVAVLLQLQYIDSILSQLTTWFLCSTIYIFSLRLIVMKYYPSDRKKHDIDEDVQFIGKTAQVIEPISKSGLGRIRLGESTWPARSMKEMDIPIGTEVEVIRRENISWIVKVKEN